MMFDTKIAVVVANDLDTWQKLNVTAFLASGIAAAYPDCIGERYEDASGTQYLELIGEPILIYGGNASDLARALDRALTRDLEAAVYTREMFSTTHDAANRAAVKAVPKEQLDLVGIAFRGPRKVIDKVVDKLKFHQ